MVISCDCLFSTSRVAELVVLYCSNSFVSSGNHGYSITALRGQKNACFCRDSLACDGFHCSSAIVSSAYIVGCNTFGYNSGKWCAECGEVVHALNVANSVESDGVGVSYFFEFESCGITGCIALSHIPAIERTVLLVNNEITILFVTRCCTFSSYIETRENAVL